MVRGDATGAATCALRRRQPALKEHAFPPPTAAQLTTYETLYYAALLRLPKSWTREQKLERVEMVLRGLGLVKARDTIIGNHMMRGVSGGERKRVSIGHELLINPAVILLDEVRWE